MWCRTADLGGSLRLAAPVVMDHEPIETATHNDVS
jgi:hypothetical protein